MTIQISKAAEQALLQQIAKECRKKILPIGGIVAVIAMVLICVFTGFPHDFFSLLVTLFIAAILTAIGTAWMYTLACKREAAKYGIQINVTAPQSDDRSYDEKFGLKMREPSVNPATGLPMAGSVDAGGNAYGSKSSR